MSKALVSLCLFGAALSVANTLTFSRSQCPSGGTEVAAADKNASAAQPGAVKIAQAKTPQAPKAMGPAPAPKDVDVTGSIDQTDKAPRPQGEKPAPVSQAQAGEVKARPAKVENEPEEWAEVSLAAKVHDAPSVSAPTVRLYDVGTKLRPGSRLDQGRRSHHLPGGMDLREVSHSEGRPRPKASRIAATITTAGSVGDAQRRERLGTHSARA